MSDDPGAGAAALYPNFKPVDFASARLDLDSLAPLTFRHYIRSLADDRSDVRLT